MTRTKIIMLPVVLLLLALVGYIGSPHATDIQRIIIGIAALYGAILGWSVGVVATWKK